VLSTQQKDDNVHAARFGGDRPVDRRDTVAAILRRAREHHGQDVRSIAQVLRIRQGYLEALESGQYDRLPGITYTIGFLRSYADYLGLNATKLVDQFKEEAQGAERHTELIFPEPVAEGRIPGGAVILISVALLAVAYGGWFYLSNQGRSVSDLIPALPEQLQTLVEPETGAPAPGGPAPEMKAAEATPEAPATEPAAEPPIETTVETTAEAAAEPAPQAEQTAAAPAEVAPPPAPSGQPAETAEAPITPAPAPTSDQGEAAAPSAETSAAEVPTEAPAAERAEPAEAAQIAGLPPSDQTSTTDAYANSAADDVPPPQPTLAPPPGAPLNLTNQSEPAQATEPAPVDEQPIMQQTVVIPAPPAPPAPAPDFAAPGERQPQTYGGSNEHSRIILRALQDSWVQVRDSQDALLLTRVLRAGDVYQVPDEPGLTLLTGNAGGIEIEVDGVKMPPLGPVGAVRRQIALDPAALTGGAARD
jgi:cytoskeleton protein RodZ